MGAVGSGESMVSFLLKMLVPLTLLHNAGAIALSGYGTTYEQVAPGVPGKRVSVGDTVTVHAVGTVQDGKQFWSTKDAGQKPVTL